MYIYVRLMTLGYDLLCSFCVFASTGRIECNGGEITIAQYCKQLFPSFSFSFQPCPEAL